jgi:hypothetical protein
MGLHVPLFLDVHVIIPCTLALVRSILSEEMTHDLHVGMRLKFTLRMYVVWWACDGTALLWIIMYYGWQRVMLHNWITFCTQNQHRWVSLVTYLLTPWSRVL